MRRHRIGVVLAAVAVLAATGVVAAYVVRDGTTPITPAKPSTCSVVDAGYEFTTEQAANAATITAVALNRSLPERAVVIALATSMQESKLINLRYGDRDSLGLFQQRPSQGWGDASQVTDPRYAAGKFFDALVGVPNWQDLPLTEAAQAVQRSGYPDEYAKWEDEATALGHALVGGKPAGLTCQFPGADVKPGAEAAGATERPADDLATGEAIEALSADVSSAERVGGDAPGTADVAPATWSTAVWLVAHAERLGIERVSFDGHTWRHDDRRTVADGWRDDSAAPADVVRIRVGSVG